MWFYKTPELVLEISLINTLDKDRTRKCNKSFDSIVTSLSSKIKEN